MIPCVCIDNSNCPIDFPLPSQWIQKGREYHIIAIDYVPLSETIGFKLHEKRDERFSPYLYFKCDRFAFEEKYTEDIMAMIERTYQLPEEEKVKVREKLKPQEV